SQVAFLQATGSISQVINLDAGTYAIILSAAQRPGNQQTFEIVVDGVVAGTVTPLGSRFATYTSDPFTVTGGSHTIEFLGLNPKGGDNTAFLDQIGIIKPGQGPLLGPLQDNGGPTATMALLPGSPAIDAGDPTLAVDQHGQPLTTDQRGVARDAAPDIGAFEFLPLPPPPAPTAPSSGTPLPT